MTLAKNSAEGKAEGYLKRIESLLAEAATAKGKYLAECKERNEDIKDIYTEAGDNGVSAKALRGLVRFRQLARKQQAIAAGLGPADARIYDNLVEALGPLGEAAARAAGHVITNGTQAAARVN